MTQRLRDWQSRLASCLAERWARPFEWGLQDCVLVGADCIHACTGTDPAADYRGTYSDERSAMRLLRSLGGVAGLAEAFAGPEVPPRLAQPGDVGVVFSADRECMGVCIGAWWVAPAAEGLALFPTATRAWRMTKAEG